MLDAIPQTTSSVEFTSRWLVCLAPLLIERGVEPVAENQHTPTLGLSIDTAVLCRERAQQTA
jgi:hypothetical protein